MATAALPSTHVITRERSTTVPWYLWVGAAAVTSAMIGGAWDVSWHRSVGRDTFWTPAHMMIYACGVLAGIVGMWLVTRSTLRLDADLRNASVTIFGLRAPLGVFIAGWGGLAMLTSAPFDNWWHNAYGLDVKIVSPPHALLILGVRCVSIGMMLLILSAMNRAADAGEQHFAALQRLFLYLGGLAVAGQMFFIQEYTWDVVLHTNDAYIALAIAVPIILGVIWQASRNDWACTITAAIYMLTIIAEILILPLVPAQPKLGPVFNPVTHLVPAKFPVLLIVPALALDLIWQRTKRWKLWQVALISGVVFTIACFAVEWPFANFLMSKASENRFFGTTYFDYNASPLSYDRLRRFFQPAGGAHLVNGLAIASASATLSAWFGLMLGRWARGVER